MYVKLVSSKRRPAWLINADKYDGCVVRHIDSCKDYRVKRLSDLENPVFTACIRDALKLNWRYIEDAINA